MVIILPEGVTPPADWTSSTDWEGVLANDDTANAYGKYLMGIGSLPQPEEFSQRVVDGVEVVFLKEYTLDFKVNTLTDQTYSFLQALQCNPVNYTMWFYTMGGYLHGGATGVQPNFTNVNFEYSEGKASVVTATVNMRWALRGCDSTRTYLPALIDNFSTLQAVPRFFGFTATDVLGYTTSDNLGF